MTPLLERLQRWRDRDHEDTIILTRGEIIWLIEEIKRLRTGRANVNLQTDGYRESKESNRE
jgi:hypothetical protein